MKRVIVRLVAFTVVLAASFGAAYAIGAATRDGNAPTHQEHMP